MSRYLLVIAIVIVPVFSVAGVNPNGPDLQASAAKCASIGYTKHPDLLTSCIRAMRADYCGDGTAHTTAGTLVNLYDRVGIQDDTANWRPEAEWTPHGAACVSSAAIMRQGETAPACVVPVRASCGSKIDKRTSVITELETPGKRRHPM